MKLYSWNVNGIRAVHQKGELDTFIKKYQPDILGLQEIKATADQATAIADHFKYRYFNSAQKKGYAGTAIFSQIKPIQIIEDLPITISQKYSLKDQYGDLNSEGRVLTAEFDNFYFVTVYTPNAKGDLSRLSIRHQHWDPAFLEYMQQLECQKPVIFCGDLNVAHTEIDLKNPKQNKNTHGFTLQERQGIDKIIKAGFVDIFRIFNQQPDNYTWWSYFRKARERNAGWRIDYFFASQILNNKIIKAEIVADQFGSDHCPVSLELND